MELNVVERRPGSIHAKIQGRLDGQTAAKCETTLRKHIRPDTRYMTFDLSGLDYISSMGIRLLLIFRKVMESRGGKMLMTNVPPKIKKVIDIANVLPSWGIFESVAEADAYFDKMQESEEDN